LRKAFGLFVLIIALGAPAGAQMMSGQSSMGMGPMQYYVGGWSCMAGPVGKPASKATATYTLDSGILRGWVLVPPQGKMKSAYALEIVTTYDAKNHRFVQTQLGNDSNWSVDYAKLWTGNTEQWVDHANSMPPLGHSQTVRTSQNRFDFTSYDTLTSMKPAFKGYCTRSTSAM
jgi:hypothetical protein